MFAPTAVGSGVDNVTEVVVAPAAMVPTRPKEGAKTDVEPAPKVPPRPGLTTKDHPFVTMLNLFRTAALTSWYAKGLRDTSERKSEQRDPAAAWAFGAGAT